MQAGERADVEAGMAKLFASETALEVATDSMRIHGGVGYTTDLPIERYFRDAPLLVIGEGTNEIQRLVIARGLLARRGVGLIDDQAVAVTISSSDCSKGASSSFSGSCTCGTPALTASSCAATAAP